MGRGNYGQGGGERVRGGVIDLAPNLSYANGTLYYSYMNEGDARTVAKEELRKWGEEDQAYFYRATSNKQEHLVKDLKSKNHATGKYEHGMSVYREPRVYDAKYIGVVKGTVVGRGSDGEPLLTNVKWLVKPKPFKSSLGKYEKPPKRKKPPITEADISNAKAKYGSPPKK